MRRLASVRLAPCYEELGYEIVLPLQSPAPQLAQGVSLEV